MNHRYYIRCALPLNGYMVAYVGNSNPDWTPEQRVSWWIVPGTINLED